MEIDISLEGKISILFVEVMLTMVRIRVSLRLT